MPMRNPFRKAGVTSGVEAPSENGGPGPHAGLTRESSSALSVKSTGEEPNEYKMSGTSCEMGHGASWPKRVVGCQRSACGVLAGC